MRLSRGFLVVLALSLAAGSARGAGLGVRGELDRINRCIHGQVLDFTNNHGADRRIWSAALCARRDLYVYLPPGYDPAKKYPLVIFLHGASQDEQFFLKSLVKEFDRGIVEGKIPPFIVAAPDGSIFGRPSFWKMASFWANSDAGRYEDYLMEDVWNFLMRSFAIHPDREAHALLGVSMGGSAAFTQAIKHKDKIKIAMGFMPALNLRWVDCHDRYMTPFAPDCWGVRSKVRPLEVVGRPKGVLLIRFHNLYGPLIGHGPQALLKLSRFNPIEVMDHYDLKPGELDLYVGYGGKDEFNITAQVDSFLYRARERKLAIGVNFDPEGRHDEPSGRRLLEHSLQWVTPLIQPYSKARPMQNAPGIAGR